MDAATKNQIILAAVGAVGGGDPDSPHSWSEQVRAKSVEIAVLLGEGSRIARAIDQVDESSVFTATIIGVKRDPRNGRGLVKIMPDKPGQYGEEDGSEIVSTEPEYTAEGAATIALARSLRGHRVAIWKQTETFTDKGGKAKRGKVVRHIEDLGEAAPADA